MFEQFVAARYCEPLGITMSNMRWFDLLEGQFTELIHLVNMYRREAAKCQKAKAYVAGCTCAGAALEAMLIAMVHCNGEDVEASGHAAKRRAKYKPLLDWTFVDLLRTASSMNWLPRGLRDDSDWVVRRAEIGDYAEALRQTRNLIHPSRYLQDHSPKRVTHRYLANYLEILDTAAQHLGARLEESIQATMNQDMDGK